MSSTILTVKNRHVAACGTPPNFDVTKTLWVSYFETSEREQWIFAVTADRKPRLYDGDGGWGTGRIVKDDLLRASELFYPEGVSDWLKACMAASRWHQVAPSSRAA